MDSSEFTPDQIEEGVALGKGDDVEAYAKVLRAWFMKHPDHAEIRKDIQGICGLDMELGWYEFLENSGYNAEYKASREEALRGD